MEIRIKPICILSKAVLTGLAAICPCFAIPLGVVDLVDSLELDQKRRISKAMERAIEKAASSTYKHYDKKHTNKSYDLNWIYDILKKDYIIEYDDYEQNYLNDHGYEQLIEHIRKTDYFIINKYTRKDAKKIISIFEHYFFEEVAKDALLSNYYNITLNKDILKNSLIIKSVSEKSFYNTERILDAIYENSQTTQEVGKDISEIKRILETCKNMFSETIHGLVFVLSSFMVFIIIASFLRDYRCLEYYKIVFIAFAMSEFIDKFLLMMIKYSEFGKKSTALIQKIIGWLPLIIIQISIIIGIMLLFGIDFNHKELYIAAAISKFVGEVLKKSSNNHLL